MRLKKRSDTNDTLVSVVCECFTRSNERFQDLLGAVEAPVAEAFPGDHMTTAVETVAAVVLAVFAISTVGAAHFAPIAHKRNVLITVVVAANTITAAAS